MKVNKDIKITLNVEEEEAVRKVCQIITEFADKNFCDKMSCHNCPFAILCPLTDYAKGFEETLNDIANME